MNPGGSVKDRAALFLIKEGIRLNKIAHLKQKDAPPPIIVEGTQLLARALQHETDHLDGVLFIDRLNSENRKVAMKEIRDSEWFGLLSEQGSDPKIKISPHNTFGLGN